MLELLLEVWPPPIMEYEFWWWWWLWWCIGCWIRLEELGSAGGPGNDGGAAGGGGGGPIIEWLVDPSWTEGAGGLNGSLWRKKSVSTSDCSKSLTAEFIAMDKKLLLSFNSSNSCSGNIRSCNDWYKSWNFCPR